MKLVLKVYKEATETMVIIGPGTAGLCIHLGVRGPQERSRTLHTPNMKRTPSSHPIFSTPLLTRLPFAP